MAVTLQGSKVPSKKTFLCKSGGEAVAHRMAVAQDAAKRNGDAQGGRYLALG